MVEVVTALANTEQNHRGDPSLVNDSETLSDNHLLIGQHDPNSRISFKDILAGTINHQDHKSMIADLDVDVLEDDVSICADGPFPEIRFSDRVHCTIDSKLAHSVVIRLLGKSIGYKALLNRIELLWKPLGEMRLIDLDNGYYLVRFGLEADYERVLTGGPWVIYGTYLIVQPWSRNFSTSVEYPSSIMVWVRLPGLPYRYYTKSLFWHIASLIGTVVCIDYNTTEGYRGKFARLAVVIDLEKPLKSGIIIDGHRQNIEYEGLPAICFGCGKYGHSKDMCGVDVPKSVESGQTNVKVDENGFTFYSVGFTGGGWGETDRDRDLVQQGSGIHAGSSSPLTRSKSLDSAVAGSSRQGVVQRETQVHQHAGRVMRNVASTGGSLSAGLVASKDKVVPVQTTLNRGNHCAVRVIDSSSQLPPTSKAGRIVPPSIMAPSSRGVKTAVNVKGMKASGASIKKKLIKASGKNSLQNLVDNLSSELDDARTELEQTDTTGANSSITIAANTGINWKGNPSFVVDGDTSMQFILWNAQGALGPIFNRYFKFFTRLHHPDVFVIFEPRISGNKADSFIRRSGFDASYRVEATGFSGGIWVLWQKSILIDFVAVSNQFVHGFCSSPDERNRFFFTFVYACPAPMRRRELWDSLLALDPGKDWPWALGGDFNVIGSISERQGGSRRYSGTWYNIFPNSEVYNLEQLGSDHRPIMLDTRNSVSGHQSRPYRYMPMWNDHPDFQYFLNQNWCSDKSLEENIVHFQSASRKWNREVFGHIGKQKSLLLARLRGIEHVLQTSDSPFLSNLEVYLKNELNLGLKQEEDMWRQKSRMQWIKDGDRNTSYYHASTMLRRRYNVVRMFDIGEDDWCDDPEILRQHACDGIDSFNCLFLAVYCSSLEPPQPTPVRSFVSSTGEWNWSVLEQLLPGDKLLQISAFVPPKALMGHDTPTWRWESNRLFSTRSAYKALSNTSSMMVNSVWRLIWRQPISQRICVFLWLVVHGGLMTNVERIRLHLSGFSYCTLCRNGDEDTDHILHHCLLASSLWRRVIAPDKLNSFMTMNLQDWIAANLRDNFAPDADSGDWHVRFSVICWQLWKMRCNLLFNDLFVERDDFLDNCSRLASEYIAHLSIGNSGLNQSNSAMILWKKPPPGWFKANTDASVCNQTALAAVGWVLRDDCGEWVFGFSRKVGRCSVLLAELWAIHDMLQHVWALGPRKVLIESDNVEAIRILQYRSPALPDHALVFSIKELTSRAWDLSFMHVPRLANRVADGLACLGRDASFDAWCFMDPPLEIVEALSTDLHSAT
ncbi:hypothetical protein GQ457_10G020040 [Hibiscus cannabinus]